MRVALCLCANSAVPGVQSYGGDNSGANRRRELGWKDFAYEGAGDQSPAIQKASGG